LNPRRQRAWNDGSKYGHASSMFLLARESTTPWKAAPGDPCPAAAGAGGNTTTPGPRALAQAGLTGLADVATADTPSADVSIATRTSTHAARLRLVPATIGAPSSTWQLQFTGRCYGPATIVNSAWPQGFPCLHRGPARFGSVNSTTSSGSAVGRRTRSQLGWVVHAPQLLPSSTAFAPRQSHK